MIHSPLYTGHFTCVWAIERPILMSLATGEGLKLIFQVPCPILRKIRNSLSILGRTQASWESSLSGPLFPLPFHWCPSVSQVQEASPEESGTKALIETRQALSVKQLPGNEGGRWALVCGSLASRANSVGPGGGRYWGRTLMDCWKGKNRPHHNPGLTRHCKNTRKSMIPSSYLWDNSDKVDTPTRILRIVLILEHLFLTPRKPL